MGLTAHNKRRGDMAAQGVDAETVKAQAHYDSAFDQCERLSQALDLAEMHLARMKTNLAAALGDAPEAEPQPVKKTAKKKTAKKKTSKKKAG